MFPVCKGSLPFTFWHLDLIDKLPPGSNGERYAVVAIDPFSKFVEIGPLESKTAANISRWCLVDILARYGSPVAVCCDNGTKFQGEFVNLLSLAGV